MALIAPGVEQGIRRGLRVLHKARRYFALARRVGMTGVNIVHREDIDDKGYDGIMQPGMTLCVGYISLRPTAKASSSRSSFTSATMARSNCFPTTRSIRGCWPTEPVVSSRQKRTP